MDSPAGQALVDVLRGGVVCTPVQRAGWGLKNRRTGASLRSLHESMFACQLCSDHGFGVKRLGHSMPSKGMA
jgi:hypothetical protein